MIRSKARPAPVTCPTRPVPCQIPTETAKLSARSEDELCVAAKELQALTKFIHEVATAGKSAVADVKASTLYDDPDVIA